MGGDADDDARAPVEPADNAGGEELNRLAAHAYRPSRIEIDDALRNHWLEVWYQPKIDLQRKCLVGAEALARIRHPLLGVLLPKTFLAAISDASIAHLSEHVLLAVLRDWPMFDQAGFNLQLSVNIPFGALQGLPIAALVRDNRPKAGHWPGIILEVTEDQIVRNLDLAQRLALELRGSGLSISIDDFGAGYASLAGQRELPFAELKIDMGFVRNCAMDSANAAVCQNAIDLAHRLGSAAVAKGIEHGADLHALQAMGCDLGQGVLLAPPMPPQALLGFLHQQLGKPMLPAKPADTHPTQPGRLPGIDRVA